MNKTLIVYLAPDKRVFQKITPSAGFKGYDPMETLYKREMAWHDLACHLANSDKPKYEIL